MRKPAPPLVEGRDVVRPRPPRRLGLQLVFRSRTALILALRCYHPDRNYAMQKPEPTQTNPTRRFTDVVERYSTVIGPGISIRGELTGSDPVDLGGTLEGDSRVDAHYCVREGARVEGRIEARTLAVAGEVAAPTLVADKIEIGASARVRATLRARVVAIAEGALFDGQVQMHGGEADAGPTVFKEQRKPRGSDGSSEP